MRFVGNLLVAMALIVGVLSAATAYQVSIDLPDEDFAGLVLTGAAGIQVDSAGKPVLNKNGAPQPILKLGDPLTPENLQKLRNNQETLSAQDPPPQVDGYRIETGLVRVQKFSFARWRFKWVFAGAVAAMLLGAGLVRTAASKKATEHRESGKSEDLMAALQDAQQRLSDLHAQLKAAADPHDALPQVVESLTALGGDLQVNFIDHLEVIRSLLPTGKMAEVMESYAVAERFTNRARSTAVDNDPREALACLETAAQRMGTTLEMLQAAI